MAQWIGASALAGSKRVMPKSASPIFSETIMTTGNLHRSRPIKRPGLRAALLNRVLHRYSKLPAERAPEQLEVKDEYLARGSRRAPKMLKRKGREGVG